MVDEDLGRAALAVAVAVPAMLPGTIEIPSGIASNRYVLPGSVSPTVMIGVTLLHVGQSSIAA